MTSTALPLLARPAPSALLGPADAAGRWPCPSPWHPPGEHEPSVLAGVPASTWWCVTCGDGGGVRDLALLLAAGDVGRARQLVAAAADADEAATRASAAPAARGAAAPLELVVVLRDGDRACGVAAITEDVVIDGLSSASSVGDLAAVLGHGQAAGLLVDGRWWPAGTALADTGIARGSSVGPVVLEVRPGPPPADPPMVTAAGVTPWTRTVHRPPRPAPAQAADEVPPPPEPGDAPGRTSLGALVPVVASVIGAAVGAVLLHQPLFLLLSLVGALATLAAHAHGRGTARRERTRNARRHAADVARWWQAVVAAHAAATARARAADELADAVARVRAGSARVWERRPPHADAFAVVLGRGDVPWSGRPDELAASSVDGRDPPGTPRDAPPAVDVLHDVPVALALAPGRVLGIVGPRPAARALTRSLLAQLAVHHGPADVVLAVVAEHGSPWRWASWLPHVAGAPAAGAAEADRLLADVVGRERPAGTALLVVVEGGALVAPRTSMARAVLAGRHGPVAAVVLVDASHELPAACTHTVHLAADGTAVVRDVTSPAGMPGQTFVPAGLDLERAREVACHLARFDDPEQHDRASALPARVGLTDLLPGQPTVDDIVATWAAAGPDPPPRTAIGVAVDGTVELDLERDGPHALVVGTTGAGKSELLRTLVVGLALAAPPDAVTFLLVDYKGGAAFDACAALPHVVGVVTDLDDALAERALRSLEAELRRREQRLRRAGAGDLRAYRSLAVSGHEPLPRLVVVVDEFATLAAELPGFLAALVGVAQRGRSLGVHLVLATQRPGASLSDDIRANTNLRIALRVPDAATSIDVVGDALAASFDRTRPGRAALRFGPGELLTVQTACSSLATASAAGRPRARRRGAAPMPPDPTLPVDDDPPALASLVEAVRAAHLRTGRPLPARPWLDPLPDGLAFDEVAAGTVGLLDDPDTPCRRALRWSPHDGLLGVLGPGAAVSAVLVTVAAAVLRDEPGDTGDTGDIGDTSDDIAAGRHVYVVASDMARWRALAAHPDVCVLAAADRERVERLVPALSGTEGLGAPGRPPALVVIDGLAALRDALEDDIVGERTWQAVLRFLASPGAQVALGIERVGAVPAALAPKLARRWVVAGTDPADAALWGAVPPPARPGHAPPLGRIVDLAEALVGQVACDPPRTLPPATTTVAPLPVDPLPAVVDLATLPAPGRHDGAWQLPVGVLDGVVPRPAVLRVPAGEHVLVAAPARGGASTALAVVAHQLRRAAPTVPVLLLASRRAPPPGLERPGRAVSFVDRHQPLTTVDWPARPFVLLVDDADTIDEQGAVLPGLLRRPDVLVVAAGRPEALRASYGSWLTLVRRSRLGLLLRPDPDLDGDLLGTVLPRRRAGTWPAGRGYLVDDEGPRVVQVASPAATVGTAGVATAT